MTAGLAVRVIAPIAFGYFFISFYRSINAVIAPDLIRDIGLDAAGLGFAASAFYFFGVVFQIPYGVLLDRFDARRLYACFLLIGVAGGVISGLAEDLWTLTLGRGLIALGASASAVTAFKVSSMWYPPERLPLANGLSLAAGGLGLMGGTAPVEFALQFYDWREIHFIIAGFAVIAALLVPVIAPARKIESSGATLISQMLGLGVILKSALFWRAAPLLVMALGTFTGFSTLWAGPWVRDVAGYSGVDTANLLLLLAGAMTASGLLTGALTAVARRAGLNPHSFVAVSSALFAVALAVLVVQWTPLPFVVFATWALFGFLAPLSMVTYAALGPQFAPELTGRLNACLTVAWMAGGFLTQNIYGIVLDQFPARDGGFSPEGHQAGMVVLLALLLAALLWFLISPRLTARSAASHDS